jgi:hypothetical protein
MVEYLRIWSGVYSTGFDGLSLPTDSLTKTAKEKQRINYLNILFNLLFSVSPWLFWSKSLLVETNHQIQWSTRQTKSLNIQPSIVILIIQSKQSHKEQLELPLLVILQPSELALPELNWNSNTNIII